MARAYAAESGLEMEYLYGKSMQVLLKERLDFEDKDGIICLLKSYQEKVLYAQDRKPFVWTGQFMEVFGNVPPDMQAYSSGITDIDLIFENILIDGQDWKIIDYEWSFDFAVPEKFMLYRSSMYWYQDPDAARLFLWSELMGLFGITPEEEEIFCVMEEHFQKYVLGNIPGNVDYAFREMHARLNKRLIFLEGKDILMAERNQIKIYYDRGNGFSEKDSYCIQRDLSSEEKTTLLIPAGAKICMVRIDPREAPCLVSVKGIRDSDGTLLKYQHNGCVLSKHLILFETVDPQVWIPLEMSTSYVDAEMYIWDVPDSDNFMRELTAYAEHTAFLEQKVSKMGRQIEQMEKDAAEKEKRVLQVMENAVKREAFMEQELEQVRKAAVDKEKCMAEEKKRRDHELAVLLNKKEQMESLIKISQNRLANYEKNVFTRLRKMISNMQSGYWRKEK